MDETAAIGKHIVYSMRDLLALQDDPARWIIPNMIPAAGRILVYGQESQYKSTIVFDLCVAVAAKTQFMRIFDVQLHGPVLLNSTESSIYENRARILAHARAHAINPADLPLHFCQSPFCLDEPGDVSALEQTIAYLKPILVVLDPLDSYFSGDENSSKETKPLRREINRLIQKYNVSFILIHHQGKSGNTPRGSSAWSGWVDASLHVAMKKRNLGLPEEVSVVTVTSKKQRNGKRGHVFSAVPNWDNKLGEITFSFYNGKDATGVANAYWRHRIYNLLRDADTPLTNSEILEALKINSEQAAEPLRMLVDEGVAAHDGKVERPCGPGGQYRRNVTAWRPIVQVNIVDNAIIMVKAGETIFEEQLATPLEDVPHADTEDPDGDGTPGAQNRSGLPPIL